MFGSFWQSKIDFQSKIFSKMTKAFFACEVPINAYSKVN